MQKLEKRNTYIPSDVQSLLVRSSMAMSLNKEDIPSEHSLKTFSNSPEGVHSQHTGRSLKPVVYVLGMRRETPHAYEF